MSRTNDHTLVKAGGNRRKPATATTGDCVDPESPTHGDRQILVRPELCTSDDTFQTTGIYLPGTEPTPASSTEEAATSIQSP